MDGSAARRPAPSPLPPAWVMPLRPERYDRGPLAPAERAALAVLVDGHAPLNSAPRRAAETALARLFAPLHDVFALRHVQESRRALATRVVCRQMHRRGCAFWQWSAGEWRAVIGATYEAFERVHAIGGARNGLRPYLLDVAYLLCGFDDFGPLWTATAFYPMARAIFAAALVDAQIARIDAVLAHEGYATGHGSLKQRHQAISVLLLLNHSPWIEHLAWDVVERAEALALPARREHHPRQDRRRARHAGPARAALRSRPGGSLPAGTARWRPDGWYAWYLAWRATGSRGLARSVAHNYGSYILYTGRWLARRHPGIVSPEQWTEETALALRAAVLDETNDLFVSAPGAEDLRRRGLLGRRLSHEAISQFLAALRRFFRDLQTKAHAVGDAPARRLPRAFDPREALATPAHVEKALAGSEPRDIAPAVWQRLAIQAARLTPDGVVGSC